MKHPEYSTTHQLPSSSLSQNSIHLPWFLPSTTTPTHSSAPRRRLSFTADAVHPFPLPGELIHFCNCVEARIRHYKWEVRHEYKFSDCYKKLVMTINGRTPGPTIFAQQGDIIVVELKNSLLTENVVIHWHGIRQIGTPWSDDTEGVIQCPILPGDTFIYKYAVDKAGTYLYHGHYGMQKEAGLYRTIIVSLPAGVSEPFAYDNDWSIILNDWYHASANEQVTGLSSIPFVFVGEPQVNVTNFFTSMKPLLRLLM